MDDWIPPALLAMPLGTRSVVFVNLIIFLLGVSFPTNPVLGAASMPARLGFRPGDVLSSRTRNWSHVYKWVTYAFIHSSFLHVFFNMMFLVGIGKQVERVMGTTAFLILVATMVGACSVVLVAAEMLCYVFISPNRLIEGNLVGFSGVLFALFTIFALYQPREVVFNLMGADIPAPWAPAALLLIQSFLFPSSSFLGHAAGMAAGAAYRYGFLRLLETPQEWHLMLEDYLRGFQGHMRRTGRTMVDYTFVSRLLRGRW